MKTVLLYCLLAIAIAIAFVLGVGPGVRQVIFNLTF